MLDLTWERYMPICLWIKQSGFLLIGRETFRNHSIAGIACFFDTVPFQRFPFPLLIPRPAGSPRRTGSNSRYFAIWSIPHGYPPLNR